MTDLLQLAKEDLTRLEALAESARLAYEQADAAVEEQRGFVNKLELYANGYSSTGGMTSAVAASFEPGAATVRAYANPPLPIDGQRRMVLTIPRGGTKRHQIGNAVAAAILNHGPKPTAKLLPYIPEELFEGSQNPKNYLSNALSKDARFIATSRGWDINPSLSQEVAEAMKGA